MTLLLFLSASSLASASISPFDFFCFLSLILFVNICSVCHNMQCLLQFVLIVRICSVGLNAVFVTICNVYQSSSFNHLHKFMSFIVMSFWVLLKSCQILSHFLRSSHFVTFKSHVTTTITRIPFSWSFFKEILTIYIYITLILHKFSLKAREKGWEAWHNLCSIRVI